MDEIAHPLLSEYALTNGGTRPHSTPVEVGLVPIRICAAIFAFVLLALHGAAGATAAPQHVAIRLIRCSECAKTPPAITVFDQSQDVEVQAAVSGRSADGLTVSLPPGYYRMLLRTNACHGDRYVGVLPGHDRNLEVTINCIQNGGPFYIGRHVDSMRGLAGALPVGVRSIALRPADGSQPVAIGAISDGAYYFDETNCRDCVIDLELDSGKRSRIGMTLSDTRNFSLTSNDLSDAAVKAGASVQGSPFNSPEELVEGPSGSVWSLDRLGNRVVAIEPGGQSREYDLPTPFSNPGDIIGSARYVWVSERNSGKIVRFAYDGSSAAYDVSGGGNAPGNRSMLRMVLGSDGRIWYVDNHGLGAVTDSGQVSTYADGGAAFQLNDLALGADGRVWVVGLASIQGRGPPFIAAIDKQGHWQRFPLAHDDERILAGKNGFWIAGEDDVLSFVDLRGHATTVALPIADMRPKLYAVDASDTVWFSDRYGNVIARATPAGVVTATYTAFGPAGISDMRIDQSGSVWVAESRVHAIEEYDKQFVLAPSDIRPSHFFFDSEDNLWYSDSAADVIGVIKKDGKSSCFPLGLSHVRNCTFSRAGFVTTPQP